MVAGGRQGLSCPVAARSAVSCGSWRLRSGRAIGATGAGCVLAWLWWLLALRSHSASLCLRLLLFGYQGGPSGSLILAGPEGPAPRGSSPDRPDPSGPAYPIIRRVRGRAHRGPDRGPPPPGAVARPDHHDELYHSRGPGATPDGAGLTRRNKP